MPVLDRSTSHGGAFQPGEDYDIRGNWQFLTTPSLRGSGPYAVPDPLATVSQIATGTAAALTAFAAAPTLHRLTVTGSATTDYPTVGAEFLSATGWTSAGWTGSWATGWTHTPGNTTPLSQSGAAVIGTKYQVSYVITGQTAGSVVITFGGQSKTPAGFFAASGGFGPKATTTGGLIVTPTTDFDGTIVLSVKALLVSTLAVLSLTDLAGSVKVEMRAPTHSVIALDRNLYFGKSAGEWNTTGFANTGLGAEALALVTSSQYTTAVGAWALNALTTGDENTGIGADAMFSLVSGNANATLGTYALFSCVGGSSNTVAGVRAAFNVGGSYNTVIGQLALFTNAGGSANVALGFQAGYYETGSNKLFIDNTARASEADGRTKALIYGVFDAVVANQQVTINGALAVTSVGAFVASDKYLVIDATGNIHKSALGPAS